MDFNTIRQYLLPLLTIGAAVALVEKMVLVSIILSLCAQPLWLITTYKAHMHLGESGQFITAIILTIILLLGLIFY